MAAVRRYSTQLSVLEEIQYGIVYFLKCVLWVVISGVSAMLHLNRVLIHTFDVEYPDQVGCPAVVFPAIQIRNMK